MPAWQQPRRTASREHGGLEEKIAEGERQDLEVAINLCPPLRDLRQFALDPYDLLGAETTSQESAEARRQAILGSSSYEAVKGVAPILKRLRDDDLFVRLTRYLDLENVEKTSNHVERENRELRQKTRYRFRSLRSISALLELLLTWKTSARQAGGSASQAAASRRAGAAKGCAGRLNSSCAGSSLSGSCGQGLPAQQLCNPMLAKSFVR